MYYFTTSVALVCFYLRHTSMTTVLSSRLHLSLVMERRGGRQQESTRRMRQRKTEQSRSRSRHRRDQTNGACTSTRTKRPVHRVAGLQAEMRCTPTILLCSQRKMPWQGRDQQIRFPTGHPLDKKIHAARNHERVAYRAFGCQPSAEIRWSLLCLMLRFVPSVSNMYVHVQNSRDCCTHLVQCTNRDW